MKTRSEGDRYPALRGDSALSGRIRPLQFLLLLLLLLLVTVVPGAHATATTPGAAPWAMAPLSGEAQQVEPGDQAASPVEPASGLDPSRMEAFFEGMIRTQLREVDIAGATLAVVQGGEVVVARGFGYADVEARRPVDPAETLFRIGSVNKLFTFVAVMQLVEAGLVELDADVNEYLDFRIPDTYLEPVRIRHLLQHTAGFEEDIRDLFTYDPDRIVPLAEWVRESRPTRVRPPGEHPFPTRYATRCATMRFEPGICLEALMRDVVAFGGAFVIRRFDSPRDLVALPETIIANCSGLGAARLLSDEGMVPIKGQLVLLVPQSDVTWSSGGFAASERRDRSGAHEPARRRLPGCG